VLNGDPCAVVQVRFVNLQARAIQVIAGTGKPGLGGAGDAAECAPLNRPRASASIRKVISISQTLAISASASGTPMPNRWPAIVDPPAARSSRDHSEGVSTGRCYASPPLCINELHLRGESRSSITRRRIADKAVGSETIAPASMSREPALSEVERGRARPSGGRGRLPPRDHS
jgi:hypothetical protein